MKAILQDMKSGELHLSDVAPPALQSGGVLVRVRRSLISLGTERAVIALAKKGPIGKAKDRPDLVRKVLNRARQEGWWDTFKVVQNLVASPIPLGYSCAGEVIAVGAGASEFRVGDRVGCAGLGFANHAEIDYIPRNLAVKLPAGATFDDGAFVALGAIALQGVRLAELELGGTVVVIGLGLVGQIALQLARAAGTRVVAFDPDPDKTLLAASLGADHTFTSVSALRPALRELTDGVGADAVLICAATKSDGPVRLAADLSRLRGRVVVVGDVGMKIDRRQYFEKEISLVVSRSYGPGRYDPSYEIHGADYPPAYVRWTERRNMRAFLECIDRGTVRLDPLVTHRYKIEDAESAYRLVTGEEGRRAVGVLLEYDGDGPVETRVPLAQTKAKPVEGAVGFGIIGAGQFAKGILLPALARDGNVAIRAVTTASGLTSRHVGQRFGAAYTTADPAEMFRDPAIAAILIATRHDEHASLAAGALEAGKAVFVEKPLALGESDLARVIGAARTNPRLMVGFNRRFAPLAVKARAFFEPRSVPLAITYRINAGPLPPESWVLDPKTGGGRIIGEVCHFVDLVSFFTDSVPSRIYAEAVGRRGHRSADPDAVTVTLTMADGSVAVIQYLTNGDPGLPKEYIELSAEGRTATLDNFRVLATYRDNRRKTARVLSQAKGHREEMAAFVEAVKSGGPMPIPVPVLVAVTRTTFLIERSLERGEPVPYQEPAADA